MTDIVDPATRSRMMSGIRSSNTNPELVVRQQLHRNGLRFRLHVRGLPGSPDLVFPKHRTVVFVHGCFWHRHLNCKLAATPASNPRRWQAKFIQNVERDQRNRRELAKLGWRVITIWECLTRDKKHRDVLAQIATEIQNGSRKTCTWPKYLSRRKV